MKSPIFTGLWGNIHIQGIAVDKKNGYIYYSFTTKLIKAKLDGEVVGSVDGLVGHLGCIAFNEDDGCVWGSLEYKNDVIGKGILKTLGSAASFEDAFYAVKFDVSKIDRLGMSADGIMTAVYLREVVGDYTGVGVNKNGDAVPHKYACSGIDGLTFAPLPGATEEDGRYLYVAYGVYSDLERDDNNHQVLLCYDIKSWDSLAMPLDQSNMHKVGPDTPYKKYFVYTGNTNFGVQNLEYDRHTRSLLMAVYRGKKPEFPNYSLFAVDLESSAVKRYSAGLSEEVELLSLKPIGLYDEGNSVYGWHFPYGATGLFSFGDGEWLISHNEYRPEGQCSYIYLYRWNGVDPFELI